ncbi:MAG: diaminopimelate epimerase [Armatimonadetes bacterium]|nr:diaminopimelate epimerase [Armatimonadota bacterium]
MQGLGNDFIVVNNLEEKLPEDRLPELARKWCDRHFGVGADGLMLVDPSKTANFRMRIFNPDGSEPQMCGNGIRCFAKYVYDRRLHADPFVKVETLAGVLGLKLTVNNKKVEQVRVDMGEPILDRKLIPMRGEGPSPVINEKLQAAGRKFDITCVSMGNPHCVIFVENVDAFPVEKIGPEIENHKTFPQRTNVEFIEPLSREALKMRVWERGAGITLACGTGACAAAVAAALTNRTGRSVTVKLPGGDLFIEWTGDNRIYMTGPAEEAYEGEIDLQEVL